MDKNIAATRDAIRLDFAPLWLDNIYHFTYTGAIFICPEESSSLLHITMVIFHGVLVASSPFNNIIDALERLLTSEPTPTVVKGFSPSLCVAQKWADTPKCAPPSPGPVREGQGRDDRVWYAKAGVSRPHHMEASKSELYFPRDVGVHPHSPSACIFSWKWIPPRRKPKQPFPQQSLAAMRSAPPKTQETISQQTYISIPVTPAREEGKYQCEKSK
ncbi:hypothetical protein BDK51DRAFT_41680 [Blyttiomyces helicus]|uniref:Uncharacterized protein n=1 Tax=Blyttiomyces helicus TaxID=388810 RepID=A0A4P9WLC6_9FUNG|nr:hypothetical protein BDK51DRAFT_41680 [Blyttiomyces helicus]|eukprot:RKO92398.1 hypothetical protein BDK51DRAFT_41680 [Blyttiomyces helicus]